jgi:hypothetical protein
MYHAMPKAEQTIVRKVLKAVLAAGYSVRVHDGEELHPMTTVESEAWDALGNTDIDRLYIHAGEPRVGSILFVWGNGEDIVSDASWNEAYPDSEAIIDGFAGSGQ